MPTTNLGLHEYSTAETGAEWCDALNADNAKIDSLPQVVESGSNSQLSYRKWSDGVVEMWGRIDTGKRFVCQTEFEGHAFASEPFSVSWPVAIADTSPVLNANVSTDGNPDFFVLAVNVSPSSATFMFLANFNEGLHEYGDTNNKILHLTLHGRWK